jgi:uncharacterized membrane protein YkvA (DUF1232 family)
VRWVLIGLGAVVATWLLAVGLVLALGRRAQARELVTFVPNAVRLFRDLLKDERVPTGSKALLLLAVAWVASPIDLIPEFLPAIGPLDDVVVVALVLRHLVRRAGPEVVRDHWRGDPRTLGALLRASGASTSFS